jgi:hypothetical protein
MNFLRFSSSGFWPLAASYSATCTIVLTHISLVRRKYFPAADKSSAYSTRFSAADRCLSSRGPGQLERPALLGELLLSVEALRLQLLPGRPALHRLAQDDTGQREEGGDEGDQGREELGIHEHAG